MSETKSSEEQPDRPASVEAGEEGSSALAMGGDVTNGPADGHANNAGNYYAEEPSEQEDEEEVEDWKIQLDIHKAAGDMAFRSLGFRTAIDEYTKALSLDPEFVVLYSNRSAAYLKNGEKSKALKDAEDCIALDPKFAKGWSRLAAALYALTRYGKAQDSYRKSLALDPNNTIAQKGIRDCQQMLDKMMHREEMAKRDGYQQQLVELERQEQDDERKKREDEKAKAQREALKRPPAAAAAADDDGDDMLNDFFDDVEEVVAKKPENVEEEAPPPPKATHAIQSHKQALGTSLDQMERLLRQNFEWRNLNPFYALQLTCTATEEEISQRYKALSLLLHPDKNAGSEKAQQAYDQVQKAKLILSDPDRAKHARALAEEGQRQGHFLWKRLPKTERHTTSLEEMQEKEVLRIFAQVEMKRREVEKNERSYEQRERKQEDEALEKERKERQFDKKWRDETRVDKRIGNWRDFSSNKKPKK